MEALDAHRVEDVRVSSTKVREALRAGNVSEANLWLGRPLPHLWKGCSGDALGRERWASRPRTWMSKTP